jgi:hypothetical protein
MAVKKKKTLIQAMEKAKADKKTSSLMDSFLKKNPLLKEELEDAVGWFIENRDYRFGWEAFYETLKGTDGWKYIPVNYRAFQKYIERNDPRLGDSHGNKKR